MGGGSLLNDLLSDLDAAIAANNDLGANSSGNDPTDDLFASLKKDLMGPSYSKPPPGMGMMNNASAGAFVVSQQKPLLSSVDTTEAPVTTTNAEDAWSAALSQFGGMSLAEEFLAADTAKKQMGQSLEKADSGAIAETTASNVVDKLFEGEEEYLVDEEVRLVDGKQGEEEIDATGGLMALLGASRAKNPNTPAKETKELPQREEVEILSPQNMTGTKAPPPSPMFPPPMNLPGGPMLPGPLLPHPDPVMLPPAPHAMPPHPMMSPPPMMPPVLMPPMGPGMPPPPIFHRPPLPGVPPHYNGPHRHAGPPATTSKGTNQLFRNRDFPALGAAPQEIEEDSESKERDAEEATGTSSVLPSSVRAHIIFNNPDPAAPPINAQLVESSLMPSRDICYIVNSMMRPLQSLDAYNDDYYHWSFVDRKSRNLLMLGGITPDATIAKALPNPVWKEVKEMAKEREIKFRESLEMRSKEFAEEKKSLGRLVKSNVNRPKALLNTAAMHKEDSKKILDGTGDESKAESDYESEQKRLRVQLWKARVAIDKGYTAFLSLTELRRLIQANAGATQLINDLTGDVKSNVNLMHASFGITIKVDSDGSRKIEVEKSRLGCTLSMPKGRILCARVIEGGILPHQSACEILPATLSCIFSTSLPAADGEDRLLRALTGLVLTVQPSVDPSILCRCLDVTIVIGGTKDVEKITGSRTRMELMHAILSRGKAVCGEDRSLGWGDKEKQFIALLK
ncbi:hypothetical protein HJC23_002799 [Cyclotella cryptica]|uniref:Uncharacterized protein n=1 Tax=Cyclotella cryptica TaxID=29204 RepID=A0ABD3PN94_9STRA